MEASLVARPKFNLEIKVRGLREAVFDTREMAERSFDMRPVLDGPIDVSVRKMFQLQFQTEGRFVQDQ